jgi:IS30 family transposase
MSHKHYTIKERESLYKELIKGTKLIKIAEIIKKDVSSISREVSRNGGKEAYSPYEAQRRYEEKRLKSRRKRIFEDDAKRLKVEELLNESWSPEQIAGRTKLEGKPTASYTTIYRALERGDIGEKFRVKLRIKHRPYHKGHKGRTGKMNCIHTIHDRPAEANNRSETGHWESDTLLGKANGCAVATHVERKSRYVVALKIPVKKAAPYAAATIERFAKLPKDKVKSFTVDHGKEFFCHTELSSKLDVKVYFCDAGNPGQRGTNENTNGLLRQFLPKRTAFDKFSQSDIDHFADLLNFRPKKCLGWRSPHEIFYNKFLHLT